MDDDDVDEEAKGWRRLKLVSVGPGVSRPSELSYRRLTSIETA